VLVVLTTGIAAAQDDSYPVITPETIAQAQEVQRLGGSVMEPVVAWSPDGARLAVGGHGGFWLYPSLEQAPVFHPLNGTFQVMRVLFAPQGNLVFLGDGKEVVAYDLAQNSIQYTLEGIWPLAFSNSGDWLAYEVDDGVHISRVDTGETVYDLSYTIQDLSHMESPHWPKETEPGDSYTQENSVTFAHFLPNDSSLIVRWDTYYSATWEGITNSGYDVWSLAGDQPSVKEAEDIYSFLPERFGFLSVKPDGQVFVIEKGSVVTENGRVVLEQDGPQLNDDQMNMLPPGWNLSNRVNVPPEVWTVAFSYDLPDDSGADAPSYVTGVWDVRTGEQIGRIPAAGALVLSPDSNRIVIDTTVYDVATGEIVARLQSDNYRILPGTNRLLLLKSDNTIHLLDAANLEDIATLDIARSDINERTTADQSYHISPETHTILFRTRDAKRLVRIDLDDGDTLAVFETPGMSIGFVMYTPDYHYLVTNSYYENRGNLVLWDIASGQPVELPSMTQIAHPILSPNSLLILWHSEVDLDVNEVILYDVALAAPVMAFPVEPTEDRIPSPAPKISFSPRSTYLGINNSRRFDVWDWKAGELVLSLDNILDPTYGTEALTFSPDDSLLAYETHLGEYVEVISVPEGELIQQINVDLVISSLRFDTDTILRLESMWPEDQDDECYDITTGLRSECPAPGPIPPSLETDTMRFYGTGIVTDLSGEELAHLALPDYVFRLVLSNDQTRLWVEYPDGTLGVWAIVLE